MMHQTETINRESANGMIPEEEINFFVALTKLAVDSTNQDAMKTVTTQASTLITPESGVIPEFEMLIEQATVFSLTINQQQIKNYPPYSAIIENLWPSITNKVMLFVYIKYRL
jgi:hypothetical protein